VVSATRSSFKRKNVLYAFFIVLTRCIDELCGAFAVWAATDEAKFLHGRFAWASWDVEELASGELRKRIDEDPYFLRTSISGLNGTNLA
jgi:hypothetical protein